MDLKLPWWMSGSELEKLKTSAGKYWSRLMGIAKWPLAQIDAERCEIFILPLLAWQRDIIRFENEPENFWRLRIKHAYANALDAGSTGGFKRIFERLGLGYVEIEQRRLPEKDWDVIILKVSDSTIARQPAYMRWLIQTYGRTCRRYEWSIITPLAIKIKSGEAGGEYHTVEAAI